MTPFGSSRIRLGERHHVACSSTGPFATMMMSNKPRRMQEGGYGSFDDVAWEAIKGLGKLGVQAGRLGAGKATRLDYAQKKAMEFVTG